jgi:hypothetical protein
MSRLNLSSIASLQNEATALSSINGNFTQIQAIVDTLLSRLGTSPNAMDYLLDMNNNRIINLPEPSSEAEPVRLADLAQFTETGEITINVTGTTGYTNVAALLAATVSAPVLYTYLEGYYETGDCGTPIHLKRIGSTEPTTHYAYYQSADGDFWLIVNAHLELKMFGAKGDATTDDTDAANAWLRSASALQKMAVASMPGTYMIGGYQSSADNTVQNRVYVDDCRDMHVKCGPGVIFKGILNTVVADTQKMFSFDSELVTSAGDIGYLGGTFPPDTEWGSNPAWRQRPKFIWEGGVIDNSQLATGSTVANGHQAWNKSPGQARGSGLGFTRFGQVFVSGLTVTGGSDFFDNDGHYEDQSIVGGDNGITFVHCNQMTVVGCFILGQPDSAFYPRNDDQVGMPGVFTAIGCHVYRCNQFSNAKFNGRFVMIGCSVVDTGETLVLTGNAQGPTGDDYQPFDITIVGNRFQYMATYGIDVERAQRGIIANNSFADWGYNRDGTSRTSTGRPYLSLIRLRGCRNVIVSNNTASMIDWNGDDFLEFGLTETSNGAGETGYNVRSYNCVWTNNIVEGRPIVANGERTGSSSRIGIGVMCRDRGSDEGSNYYIDNVARNIVTQIYIFANAQHVRLAPANVAYPAP